MTNKVPSLGELRESLASLTAACQDTASDKVRDHHYKYVVKHKSAKLIKT